MKHYGIQMEGDFIGQKVTSNPSWTTSDEGRLIYNTTDGYYYYADDSGWVKFCKYTDLTNHSTSDGTDHSHVGLNDIHRTSDGTDHSYIDQNVTSGSSPTFDGSNFTGVFPSGGIIMWSGSISSIPTGWYLCDGNNSTPNLTDRFVIHADGSTNNVGDTGGSNTIAESQLPSHSHSDGTLATDGDSHSHGNGSLATNTTGSHNHSITNSGPLSGNLSYVRNGADIQYYNSSGYSGDHSHTISGSTDSDTHSHDVTGSTGSTGSGSDYKPKYYALAYIMKG